MDRTSRLGPMAALLLAVLAPATEPAPVTTDPAIASNVERVQLDLREAPLPADEPEAARRVVTCALPDPELCDGLTERLLELPFAWHRTGYTVELADGADARASARRQVTGLALAHSTGGPFSSVAEDLADMAMAWLTDGEFAVRSSTERERFRTGLSGSVDAAHAGGPEARR